MRLILGYLLLFSGAVWCEEGSKLALRSSGPVSSSDVLQWLFALLLVLAVFLLLAWLLRKSGTLGFASRGQLAVIAGLPLGMREKLVLVRVGEKQLLLGVSNGRIEKLLELEGDQRLYANIAEHQPASSAFAEQLMQALRGGVKS